MAFDASSFLPTVSTKPGVYQMFDAEGILLYVGKAKNLKNRVSSYFRSNGLNAKTVALIQRIDSIHTTITGSETEALLLEQNLIKAERPPYNILLKDDKSYPYIFVSNHEFPLLTMRRGKKSRNGTYFGPFPSSVSVRESITFLQRLFKLRNCEDSYFNNRSRPCLQFQIGRCSAPCTGEINANDYAADLRHAELFLQGKNQDLLSELQQQMDQAAEQLAFERAAEIRDQVQYLRRVQEQQSIDAKQGNIDVLAAHIEQSICAVHLAMVRQGRMLGSKVFYPKLNMGEDEQEALNGFIAQYYLSLGHEIPDEIITSHALSDSVVLTSALSERRGRKVKLSQQVRSDRMGWLRIAQNNAQEAVRMRMQDKMQIADRYVSLKQELELERIPMRMECFDISHSHGEATVASCVVFDQNGPQKSEYRRFNISGVQAGDDYDAMRQALTRRFKKVSEDGKKPDLLLIDGGKGQVGIALEVLQSLDLVDIPVLGVSKGTSRKPGLETLLMDGAQFTLDAASPALHLIQHIRDEAHRFAITSNRFQVSKARRRSALEGIPGVGPKRRRELIRFFGDAQQVQSASATEIAKVPGISQKLAQEIYDALHEH